MICNGVSHRMVTILLSATTSIQPRFSVVIATNCLPSKIIVCQIFPWARWLHVPALLEDHVIIMRCILSAGLETPHNWHTECTSSINNDTLYGDIIDGTTLKDGCPSNSAQASRYFAYSFIDMFELTLDPVYAGQFCVTQKFPQRNTILCCYG